MRKIKISKLITDKTDGMSVDMYFSDISKIDCGVTYEEERELSKKIKAGDQQALNKLVEANLRFVVSVAKKYQNQGMQLPDLINEGNIGLIEAAKRFDETKGYKFISYAVWWIRQAILRALGNQSRIVRIPLNKVGDLTKLSKVREFVEQEYERDISAEDISEYMNIDIDEAGRLHEMSLKYLSLDAKYEDEDSEACLLDTIENINTPSPDGELMYDSLKYDVGQLLLQLNQRELDIITLFFGLNGKMTLREISEKMDIHIDIVRKTKEKGMKKLRRIMKEQKIH